MLIKSVAVFNESGVDLERFNQKLYRSWHVARQAVTTTTHALT